MHISAWKLAAASLSLLLLAFLFGALALLVGAAIGHRSRAIALQPQLPSPRTSSTRSRRWSGR